MIAVLLRGGRRLLALGLVALFACFAGFSQSFERYFTDSTLRVDYIFSGDKNRTLVSVDELHRLPQWYGRRINLDTLALRGNGRIMMVDSLSQRLIYCTSFSSLFHEWLGTPEADQVTRAFEHICLLPYPKATVGITIELDNIQGENIAKQSFYFRPQDILVRDRQTDKPLPYEYLHRAKYSDKSIDIAILAEGYTASQLSIFIDSARRVSQELLSYAPFSNYKDYINIVAVRSPSQDSGVSLPRLNDWKETAFSAHFDTFYSERYLTSRKLKAIHESLVNIPYEHIIILANTPTYGGGGIYNSLTLSSTHPKYYLPVVVHEFGHSFGGLADEYYYEEDMLTDSYALDREPWEQNITTLRDFDGKKWSKLLVEDTPRPTPLEQHLSYPIGLYEGAAYTAKGIYRASMDCRMRSNVHPTFCLACHQALEKLILYYIGKE